MSWNPLGGLGPKPWILPPPAAAPSALPAPPRVGEGGGFGALDRMGLGATGVAGERVKAYLKPLDGREEISILPRHHRTTIVCLSREHRARRPPRGALGGGEQPQPP